MVVDRRSGAFVDDLYMVLSDNRIGTRESTNTAALFFKSTDGGATWLDPTRVNHDTSTPSQDRDSSPGDPGCAGPFGNDNFFPWVDVSLKGDVNIAFHDRRLDTTSTLAEWPTSRSRTGNYLVWFWGAICSVTTTGEVAQLSVTIPSAAQQCLAPGGEIIRPPASAKRRGRIPSRGRGLCSSGRS